MGHCPILRQRLTRMAKWAINRTTLSREGWISVEDMLPEDYQYVLVYGNPNDGGYGTQHCAHSNGIFRLVDTDSEHKGLITHWQPLPNPPITDNTQEIRSEK